MATTTGPNLKNATALFQRFFDDTCEITRDTGNPNNAQDDIFDPVELTLTPVPIPPIFLSNTYQVLSGCEDPRYVYKGKCKFSPQLTSEPRYAIEAETTQGKRFYNFALPVDAPTILVGDQVKITSSRRDQNAVNQIFYVREVVLNSWAIQRKLIVEHREDF